MRNSKRLAKENPGLHGLTLAIRESAASEAAVRDAEDEVFGQRTNEMMLDIPKAGEVWWIETVSWVVIGRVFKTCRDCIVIKECVQVHYDGRHGQMWAEGDNTAAEIEPHGGPDGIDVISADSIIRMSPWPHSIPKPH